MTFQLLARMLYRIHLCSTTEPSLMASASELVTGSSKVRVLMGELSMPVTLIEIKKIK